MDVTSFARKQNFTMLITILAISRKSYNEPDAYERYVHLLDYFLIVRFDNLQTTR